MLKFMWNLQYVSTPLLIILAMIGVVVGGAWTWLGVWLFLLAAVLDRVARNQNTPGAKYDEETGMPLGVPVVLNNMMYVMLGFFVLLQIALAYRVMTYVDGTGAGTLMLFGVVPMSTSTTLNEMLGAMYSAGIWGGMGIIFGHELAHTKGFSFVIARWMMALSGASSFCYAHVYNHHLELGHEDDPATAPRGRTIYGHLPLSYLGQSKFLYNMEKDRLTRLGKPFLTWQNRWIRGYFMSLPTVVLFWMAGGWIGLLVMLGIWLIANFELEALNYMEHYGLIREKGEPIDYRHSWDNSTALTSPAFIEIGRQADHHDRGETHFWELEAVGAPDTGRGYIDLYILALIPPLWHKYMRKVLHQWDENFATESEKAIADKLNARVGYGLSAEEAAAEQGQSYMVDLYGDTQ